MFKKIPDLGNKILLTKSDAKDIRNGLVKSCPAIEEFIDELFPKKSDVYGMRLKSNDKVELAIVDDTIICYKKGKEYVPTLWLLHQYPHILPKFQVDKGAIRFVLSGANIMCPGLTSAGGSMEEVEAGTLIAIHAEGKTHAIAVGATTMSTKEIRETNKDIGVNNLQYVGDDLWKLDLS